MGSVRVKICGMTRPEDALAAAHYGADAIGLVFFSGSRRCVDIEQARRIIAVLPPLVAVVALFVNAEAEYVNRVLRELPIDVLQFHGDEDAGFCRSFRRPYWKAVRVRSREDIQAAFRDYPDARAIVLDAWSQGEYGGTGKSFDWSLLPEDAERPWILAGGLTPDNIAAALQQTRACAVDVSGGVEESAGIKSPQKTAAFIRACKVHSYI